MTYTTLDPQEMTQNELTAICGELQVALNQGLDTVTLKMNIGVERTMIDIRGHLKVYRKFVKTKTGALRNTGFRQTSGS